LICRLFCVIGAEEQKLQVYEVDGAIVEKPSATKHGIDQNMSDHIMKLPGTQATINGESAPKPAMRCGQPNRLQRTLAPNKNSSLSQHR
jgi:hypothetical protein